MSTLPETTLALLQWWAESGNDVAKALLHLIARADKRDQDVAKFVDSYSSTIAALCRRLESLERGARLRHPVEDAEATESDSVADTAQRITDYASKAGLTVQDWAKEFNAAQVDDSPVANALTVAEAALADVAEGEPVSPFAYNRLHWAETRCTEALAAIRPVMKKHGIRTSEFPPAAPAPAPTPSAALQRLIEAPIDARGYVDLSERKPAPGPTPPPTALVELVGNELPLLPDGRVDEARTRAAISKMAAWLDSQGHQASGNCLRSHLNR
jgi:hypothetical protein